MSIFSRAKATPLEGEQGVPDTDDGMMVQWRKYGSWAAMGIASAAIVYQISSANQKPEVVEEKEVPRSVNTSTRNFDRQSVTQPIDELVEEKAEEKQVDQPAETETVRTETVVVYRDRPPPPIPRIDKGRSAGQVVSTDVSLAQAPQSAQPSGQSLAGQSAQPGSDADDNHGVERAYASQLDNLDTKILQGRIIPCTLHNALNTQLSGMASCTVSRDIWNADNSRILIAEGSQVNGTYQTETSSAAVTRIGIIWGRLVTTEKIAINVGSPASDPQGATGVPADSVNYHFWKRFGSAFLVSMIDGAISNIGSTGNTSGDVVVNSATGTSSSLASEIIGETAGMPSTRKANRGAEVAIYLNRDLIIGRAQ